MNTKNIWLFIGVLVAVSLASFFILKKPQTEIAQPVSTTPAVTAEPRMGEENESITEIEVKGKEFSFSPSTISVKSGDKVRIVFRNEGTMTHDFVIEELRIRTKVIRPGETDTIEFTVPDDGSTLTYYCSVGTHRILGMEGTFSIE